MKTLKHIASAIKVQLGDLKRKAELLDLDLDGYLSSSVEALLRKVAHLPNHTINKIYKNALAEVDGDRAALDTATLIRQVHLETGEPIVGVRPANEVDKAVTVPGIAPGSESSGSQEIVAALEYQLEEINELRQSFETQGQEVRQQKQALSELTERLNDTVGGVPLSSDATLSELQLQIESIASDVDTIKAARDDQAIEKTLLVVENRVKQIEGQQQQLSNDITARIDDWAVHNPSFDQESVSGVIDQMEQLQGALPSISKEASSLREQMEQFAAEQRSFRGSRSNMW